VGDGWTTATAAGRSFGVGGCNHTFRVCVRLVSFGLHLKEKPKIIFRQFSFSRSSKNIYFSNVKRL
jgi:hypothetical protein